ncbi:MAG: 50S ribosomal protein L22 [Candidatus Paceibacterota bacterium]
MKAILKNYRQSPRKVRLVADLVRGKRADESLLTLEFTPKRASETVSKLIESAVANAVNNDNKKRENLFVNEITVDEGFTIKRHRPRARGRASKIRKRTSHITVILSDKK